LSEERADVIRTGRGQMWWQELTGEPVRRPTRSEQARSLIRVLDAAAEAQPRADEIVAACGEEAPIPPAFARDGARLQVAYYRLRRQLDDLVLDAEWEQVRERAGVLLLYHQWVLREALSVAFSLHIKASGRARYRINGLGEPADRLRELRGIIRAQAEAGA
jgi:hypothetical protein